MDGLTLGITLAILASLFLNIGKGVQKWKVKVLAHRGAALRPPHRRDLILWIVGILMTTVATGLYSAALKFTDKSSMVSSFNGVGMLGLVAFAWLVLKERIGKQELGGAALVLVGTALMGLFDQPVTDQAISPQGLALAGGLLGAIFVPLAIFSWVSRRWHGFTFGALAGAMIGVSMVLGDLALVAAGGDMTGQMNTPWPYVALTIGTGALGVTQLAFWRANAMIVVPTTNSFVILTPVFIEWLTSGTVLHLAQYGGLASIVAGVILLTAADRGGQDDAEVRAPAPA